MRMAAWRALPVDLPGFLLYPSPNMNYLNRARKVFDIEIEALQAVRDSLNPHVSKAVRAILETLKTRGKIVVAGIGKSGNIGIKMAATFNSTGTTCVVLNSVDALHGDLGIISDGDLVILLSYSGESEELLTLVSALKRFSIRLLAMTGNIHSSLSRHCDLVLDIKVPREACPFNLAPTASTTAMLAMGDALAMTVLHARGFNEKDFAKHHPSGAIGRALLLKVKDIMRSEQHNPVARQTQTVQEALFVMTQAKSGCVSVVDSKGKLVGVFTDGDLRRQLMAGDQVLTKPLKSVMTAQPHSISHNAMAIEVVAIFNDNRFDDLIVVNDKHQPIGIVDSQDLPKLKWS